MICSQCATNNPPSWHTCGEDNVNNDVMTFGGAIEALKKGLMVARKGWNGKGMFLKLQRPDEGSKMTFPYPFFTIPNCEEGTRVIPYASTIVDIMSEDWVIID